MLGALVPKRPRLKEQVPALPPLGYLAFSAPPTLHLSHHQKYSSCPFRPVRIPARVPNFHHCNVNVRKSVYAVSSLSQDVTSGPAGAFSVTQFDPISDREIMTEGVKGEKNVSTVESSSFGAKDVVSEEEECKNGRKKPRTFETRKKISYSMLGRPKSTEMRAKVSEKLKGRVPWNKGKKMSPETRARMSAASVGRQAWNKGRRLSNAHREAISFSSTASGRKLSDDTRARMRMARRRPGDAVVAGSFTSSAREKTGSYSLLDGSDINSYVSLRRELRVWSDGFTQRNGRRPTLADIRRLAPVPVIRKFEAYVAMREKLRGLAGDVYGGVDPSSVPGVSTHDLSNSPRNNNGDTKILITKYGNPRLISESGTTGVESVGYSNGNAKLEGALEDMWDMYDRPSSWKRSASTESDNTLIGTHSLNNKGPQQLSANDYRKIGRYRLMETMDIYQYVALRKELQAFSAEFKRNHGRIPSLSDARSSGSKWYTKFCDYLDMRDKMEGLVEEVYGTKGDDLETLKKVNEEGKEVLKTLLNCNRQQSCEDRE